MSRLTIDDKKVQDMGYMELAHNMTFPKDGEIWYHDYTDEISLRNLIRGLAKNFNIEITEDNDLFDEVMIDWLAESGAGSIEGLLALLNYVFIGYDDLRCRLKHHEDLEEQGRLIELPCKVGDTVYVLREKNIEEAKVFSVKIESVDDHWCFMLKCMVTEGYFKNFKHFMYGKTVFLTKEEAEARLKELQGERWNLS